jgi:carbonic anhydrase
MNNQSSVLAFFMKAQVTDKTHEEESTANSLLSMRQTNEWKQYFDASQKLTHPQDSVNISLNLNLLMGQNLNEFWRYDGSFTTPPCTEIVVWNIFKEMISLFDYEFDTFRHDLFFESFRGPQPLYYRKVYRSFATETISSIPDERCCITNSSSGSSLYLYQAIFCILIIQIMFFKL